MQKSVKDSKNVVKNAAKFVIPGLWALGLGSGLWPLGSGLWALDPGLWPLESGLWTLASELWNLDSGRLWTLASGLSPIFFGLSSLSRPFSISFSAF